MDFQEVDGMDVNEILSNPRKQKETLTFREYLEKVLSGEIRLRNAHAYLLEAVEHLGVNDEGIPLYFENKLFGADQQLKEFMALLRAGAQGQDVRRRILLLVGPPGGAKSTFVYHLKRALEDYSRRPEGRLYRIKGCPINEDPIRAVPDKVRPELEEQLGIKIDQHLCPYCTYLLEEEWGGDLEKIEVESFEISEARGVGIGVFAAGEPNTQDASHLVGAVSLSGFQKYGSESHPMAWSYDGALLRGNRGIAELVELLKAKPELLHYLLTTAQERQVPVDRVGFVDVDLVLVAHTNYSEYHRFWKEPRNEAIRDRVRVVEWPYAMRVRDERKIYMLMLGKNLPAHLAPWTLTFAAAVAVLSRLQTRPSDSQFTPMVSLKLYNTRWADNHYPISEEEPLITLTATRQEYDEMRARFPEDGKDGLSPRSMVDWISSAAIESDGCLNPIALSRKIYNSYKEGQTKWTREQLLSAINYVLSEYHVYLDRLMQKAFVRSFEEEAEQLWRKYLDHAAASTQNRQVQDPLSGKWVPPDTKFLRQLEEAAGIGETTARSFRLEILALVGALSAKGEAPRWNADPRMAKAIESVLMSERLKAIRTTVTSVVPDEEQAKLLQSVQEYLVQEEGYCEKCAKWVLEYYAHRMRMGST